MDLSRLDRRIIFLIIAIVVIVPMLFNITPEVQVTKDTQQIYDAIDSLNTGDYIMVSFDFEAA